MTCPFKHVYHHGIKQTITGKCEPTSCMMYNQTWDVCNIAMIGIPEKVKQACFDRHANEKKEQR